MKYLKCINGYGNIFTTGEYYKIIGSPKYLIRVRDDSNNSVILDGLNPYDINRFEEVGEEEYVSSLMKKAREKFEGVDEWDAIFGLSLRGSKKGIIGHIDTWHYYPEIDSIYTQPKGKGGFCAYRNGEWGYIKRGYYANKVKLKFDFSGQDIDNRIYKCQTKKSKFVSIEDQDNLIREICQVLDKYGFSYEELAP